MRPRPAVRLAVPDDQKQVIETLARAFWADPFLVHFYPDERVRQRRIRRFFDLLWRANMHEGCVEIAGTGEAAALWRRPRHWRIARSTMLAQLPRMAFAYGLAAGRVLASLRCMERHHLAEPHWYLMTLGTDPAAQGRGLGGALVRAGLERSDRAGLPAYLESGSAANIPFYEGLGFELLGEVRVPGGPAFFPMRREPSTRLPVSEQRL
jgi:ribosomal protein S18 acetylase RimI-like enzyme